MPRDHPLLPYAVTLAAVALFSLMDALMKGAALAVGAYSALLLRNAIGLALIALGLAAIDGRLLRRVRLYRAVTSAR